MSAIQVEYRFLSCTDNVYVSRPVIIGIDDYAQSIESEDRRHNLSVPSQAVRLL